MAADPIDSQPHRAHKQYSFLLEYLNTHRLEINDGQRVWLLELRDEGMSGIVLFAVAHAIVEQGLMDQGRNYLWGVLRNIIARCDQDSQVFERVWEARDLYGGR